MRLAGIVVIALLGVAPAAHADVFVPADPPPNRAVCAAAADDVVVTARFDRSAARVFELSEGGGAWRRLFRASVDDCPSAAAAADGTVAVAAGGRLWVRRGGRLAAPVRISERVEDLAVAPGGWAVAVSSAGRFCVLATVVRPDGGAQTTTLAQIGRDSYPVLPRAGIDATGAATIAWTRLRFDHPYEVTAVRLAAGAVTPVRDVAGARNIDVAVAPGGRTLLAWAQANGVAVSIDGGTAERLGPVMEAAGPRAEIADDGSALIAYTTIDGVLTADRAAGGPWLSHRLWATRPVVNEAGEAEPLDSSSLTATLSPDGRAAVAWPDVLAAAGRAGGDWGRAVRQSAVTREADAPSLTLAPTGEPRLVWVERANDAPNRLRGARLAAGAAPDTTAPVLTTALPIRTPRTKTARATLRVPVTCSEACDAAVRLVDRRGTAIASAVRELGAGRRATFALSPDRFSALLMLTDRRDRQPMLEVVVTDRAGNVARQSHKVTFRVVDRPMIELQVEPGHDFAMFSKAGDRAVGRLVNDLIARVAHHTIKSERELRRRYVAGRAAIRRTHDEIDDTEVGDAIFAALYVPCKRRGYDPEYVVSG